jgi:hypothetical protein
MEKIIIWPDQLNCRPILNPMKICVLRWHQMIFQMVIHSWFNLLTKEFKKILHQTFTKPHHYSTANLIFTKNEFQFITARHLQQLHLP